MTTLIVLAAAIAASFQDPLFLLFLAVAVGAGLSPRWLMAVLAVAIIAAAVRTGIAINNQSQLGLPASDQVWLFGLATFLAVMAVGSVAAGIRRMMTYKA